MLSGCGGSWWPFGGAAGEANRVPAGATEYSCAEGKRLLVRFASDQSYAWVYLPEREFRLDRGGSDDRYSNGASTLSLQGDSIHLDTEGSRLYADCKRKAS
jgi:hypothetical protein